MENSGNQNVIPKSMNFWMRFWTPKKGTGRFLEAVFRAIRSPQPLFGWAPPASPLPGGRKKDQGTPGKSVKARTKSLSLRRSAASGSPSVAGKTFGEGGAAGGGNAASVEVLQ